MLPIPLTYKQAPVLQPLSLSRLCVKRLALDATKVFGGGLRADQALPCFVCEPLAETLVETFRRFGDGDINRLARLFADRGRTRLRSVRVRHSVISDAGLELLLRHEPVELELVDCESLTHLSFVNVLKHAPQLQSLTIGPMVSVFNLNPWTDPPSPDESAMRLADRAPNLERLTLRLPEPEDRPHGPRDAFLGPTLEALPPRLKMLDLSHCADVGSLLYLSQLASLHTLILYDVCGVPEVILNLCHVKSLV